FRPVKIGRKHKSHRQELQSSKPWRESEKGRKGNNKNNHKGKGRWNRMGQDQSAPMVDENTPTQTLESRTLESVAKYIQDGRAQNIVVMVGAGISTSAGIPDFRSPDTGLYANLSRLNLPHAEAVFEISYFRNNPHPFYTLAQELYPGKYRPTITHSFIALLHQKGLLLKLFTQNIDCLEREAGLPGHKIIEAHGSFANQCCIDCKHPYPKDLMDIAIKEKSVPHCITEECDGLVKPEIVFFGEQLPSAFFDNRRLPAEADLCIVMGTSLSVQPFAALPHICAEHTPRVLVNSEQVGGIGSRTDDVLLLGDCDGGVKKLAEALGWLEELEELWETTALPPSENSAVGEQPIAKTRDEILQEEIDKITKDVEESLKLDKAQYSWLESHIENRLARAQDESTEDNLPDFSNGTPTGTTPTASTSNPSLEEKDSAGEGLGHVFPHLEKKPSL
ncbi:NAD-dependent deacetylase sirtuin-2, partial [Amniculicola lignicola CBS 123094]